MFEAGIHIVEACILFSFSWCINTKHRVFKGLPPFYRNTFGFWKREIKLYQQVGSITPLPSFWASAQELTTKFLEICKNLPGSTEHKTWLLKTMYIHKHLYNLMVLIIEFLKAVCAYLKNRSNKWKLEQDAVWEKVLPRDAWWTVLYGFLLGSEQASCP